MKRSTITLNTLFRPSDFSEGTVYLYVFTKPIPFKVPWSSKRQLGHFAIEKRSRYRDVGTSYYAFNQKGQFVVSYNALLGVGRHSVETRITKSEANEAYILREVRKIYPQKTLPAEFRKQTNRLIRAVDHAKAIRDQAGYTNKTVREYSMNWKSALKKGYTQADQEEKPHVSNRPKRKKK